MKSFIFLEILFHGVSQIVSTVGCISETKAAALSGGVAAPLAVWSCSSTWLNTVDKVNNPETGGKPWIKLFAPANTFAQQIISCVRKDWIGCIQPIGDAMGSGLLDSLKPENICKKDTAITSNINVGKIDFAGTNCKISITNFKLSSDDGMKYNVSFDFEDNYTFTSPQYMQISFQPSCDSSSTSTAFDVANLTFYAEDHGHKGHKETTISSHGEDFSCIYINNGFDGCGGKLIPIVLEQTPPPEICTENIALKQWCLKNHGTWFDTINACQILSANKELANQCNSSGMNSRIENYFMGVLNCYSTGDSFPCDVTETQTKPSCVSPTTYDQWCRDNDGFNFDYGTCLAHFGSKEKMLEGLKQCEAFGGHGKDEALNRITCKVTLCE